MAIEIKELVIRAIVADDNIMSKNKGKENSKGESDSISATEQDEVHDDIIAACVEQVLEILEKRIDR